jgi:hypothetical protein
MLSRRFRRVVRLDFEINSLYLELRPGRGDRAANLESNLLRQLIVDLLRYGQSLFQFCQDSSRDWQNQRHH